MFDNQEEILHGMGGAIYDDLQEKIAQFASVGFEDDILALEDPEVHLIDLEKMAGDVE